MRAQISHRNRKPAMPDKCASVYARALGVRTRSYVTMDGTIRWRYHDPRQARQGKLASILQEATRRTNMRSYEHPKDIKYSVDLPPAYVLHEICAACCKPDSMKIVDLIHDFSRRIGYRKNKILPRFYKFLSCIHFNHFKSLRRQSVIFFTKSNCINRPFRFRLKNGDIYLFEISIFSSSNVNDVQFPLSTDFYQPK